MVINGRTDIRKLRFRDDGKIRLLCGHHLSELIARWQAEHPGGYYPYHVPWMGGTWDVVGYWDRYWDDFDMHNRPEDWKDYVCERCAEMMARMNRDLSEDKIPRVQVGFFEKE